MHVRLSQVIGLPVVDDSSGMAVGLLESALIEPDTGKIAGFFVLAPEFSGSPMFLNELDIIGWGTKVHILDSDRLAPPEDLLRLRPLLDDPRRVIGQRIIIQDTKVSPGKCSDIQFDTRHRKMEWIFPRKFLMTGTPIPASDILEITAEAIIVKNPLPPIKQEIKMEQAPSVVTGIIDTTPATMKANR